MIGQSSGKAAAKIISTFVTDDVKIVFPSLMDSMAPLFMENARLKVLC